MRWFRPTRLPILIAWLVIIGVVSWLATHPRLVAPYASRLVSRHLLRLDGPGLRVRDFHVRTFEGLDLYGVSLNLAGAAGGVTLVSADTVVVDFKIGEILGVVPHVRRVLVSRPEVYSRAGHDTTVTAAKRDAGTLFPNLEIDQLVVNDAYLEFSGSDGRLTERISKLDWRGGIKSGDQLALHLRGCDVLWDTHDSQLEQLRGDIVIDEREVAVPELFGTFNGSPVAVAGTRTWAGDLDLSVEAVGVAVAEVENLIDMTIGFTAEGDLVGTFVTDADALLYEGVFSGELEGYRMRDLRGQAAIGDDKVVLSGLSGEVNGATFTGFGVFDVASSDSIAFFLEGDATQLNLQNGLIPGEDEMPATDGSGRLRIEHTDNPLWTRVTGVLERGFIETIPFDTCYVDVEVVGDSVIFNRVELMYRDLLGVVEGSADTNQVFRGAVSLASENLHSLPPGWGWPDVGGRMYAEGTVEGPLDDLNFTGWTSLYDFTLSALGARYSEVALVVDDVLGDPVITAGIDGDGFQLGDVPLGDYLLWGSVSSEAAHVDSFRSVLGDTTVTLRFQAGFADSISQFLVEEFRVEFEGYPWTIDEPVRFSIGDGHFLLPGARLESAQGTLEVNGLYERGQVVGGNLELRNFALGMLDPFVDSSEPLAGQVTADVIVGGEPDTPEVNLTAELRNAPFALATIDTLQIAAGFSQGVFDFQELDLRTNYGRIRGAGSIANPDAGPSEFWDGAELDMELEIREGDWAFLDQFAIPALDRLAGRFDGTLQVGGSSREPLIRGDVRSAPFHVHWLHLDELTGEIWADSEELILGDLRGRKRDLNLEGRIELPMELDLLSEPTTPLDGPFYMQLEIPENSNLAPLNFATNAFVQVEGRGEAQVIVSGPLEHPFYQGSVAIRDAGFVLRDLAEVYYDASCTGVFRGDELLVSNIQGKEGARGTFAGEGSVLFNGLELETFDIRLNLERFLVASVPDLRLVVSSENGRMTGAQVGPDSMLVPRFSGNMEVLKGRYEGDFSEKGGGNDPLQGTVAPDWLADLRIHAAPRTMRIVNRDMELYLGGDVNLVRAEDGLYLRGSMDVNTGRLIVFNNTFNVERGRLDFSQEVGFDPRMDVDAVTRYRLRSQFSSNSIIETIGVHVGGTLSQPEISFSSDRGYSREAIQRMLLGLEPYATPEGDADNLRATSISAGFNLVEREIARELDIIDTIEIDVNQRRRETGETGLDPLLGVGKYIGSDLYLKYAQGVRQDDRDFLVEYQINAHLLLQSEIRRRIDENQGQPTYNLDLKYRFEY